MPNKKYQADVVVVGGGLAGIITAIELLNANKKVLILDRDTAANLGGLAKWSFGGMFFVNSQEQRRQGIKDSTELALDDWFSYAEFEEDEYWGKKWAEQYIHFSTPYGHRWLKKHGIKFFFVLNWAERGLFVRGNSVPRFHMTIGTGWGLTHQMIHVLKNHPKATTHLQIICEHRVSDIIYQNNTIKGVRGTQEKNGAEFEASADVVVVATGGINGSIERVKKNWFKPWGAPPKTILNGAHPFAVGDLHDATQRINGNVVNLEKQWNYAAGIRHYKPRHKDHGLSLVPSKSALWLNYEGKRFEQMPLLTAFDTRYIVERICQEPIKYSWQVLNFKIAKKEFAISGSEHNELMRDKKVLQFIYQTAIKGSGELVNKIIDKCEDVVTGRTVEELVENMNAIEGNLAPVKLDYVKDAISKYDAQIDRGKAYHNDPQLRLIAHARQYRGDKTRTCNFQKIVDDRAMPLIAIREFILSRKSLGGIQTNLNGQVLTTPDAAGQQQAIEGLYAVGEAAGFGGGGIHGHRSLEGTFLGGCVITGRVVGRAISGQPFEG